MKKKLFKLIFVITALLGFHLQSKAQSIVGPDTIDCPGSYGIVCLRTGETVTWSTSGQIAISGSNTSNTVTIAKTNSGANGSGILTATIATGCSFITITKSINTKVPTANISGPTQICIGDNYNFNVPSIPGAISYTWTANPSTIFLNNGGQGQSMDVSSYLTGSGSLSCVVITTCDTVYMGEFAINMIDCHNTPGGGGGEEPYAVMPYPNPVDDYLTVSSRKNNSATVVAKAAAFHFKLVDKAGKVVREGDSNGVDKKVDVKGLTPNIYFLNMTINGKNVVKQIIVQHK